MMALLLEYAEEVEDATGPQGLLTYLSWEGITNASGFTQVIDEGVRLGGAMVPTFMEPKDQEEAPVLSVCGGMKREQDKEDEFQC